MKKSKTYQIKSFEDLGKVVTEENIDRLFADLKESSLFHARMKKINKTVIYKGVTWCDDGIIGVPGINVTFK